MKSYSMLFIALAAISVGCAYIYASNKPNQNKQQPTRQEKDMIQTGDILDISTFQKVQVFDINNKPLLNSKNEPVFIYYKIVAHGASDGKKPLRGEQAEVHYTGYNLKILNGVYTVTNSFDNSYDRGRPFLFQVGAGLVIKGWDLMIADMQEGETRIVILPPEVAYGARGAGQQILPNATLVFSMHLVKIR